MRMKVGLVAIAVTCGSGCFEERGCTEVGCVDGASISLRAAGGVWRPGEYSMALTVDGGAQHRCSWALPAPGWTDVVCDPPVGFPGVRLEPEVVCREQRKGDAVTQLCTPVPDRYTLRATLAGTPGAVRVAVVRDGVEVLDETRTLAYTAWRPNGPDCEPICRQASAELALP